MNKPDLSLFPATPGVYLFKDEQGRIVYVGKAVRLRNRLASYFRPEHSLTPKTRLMLQQARDIDILRTETEKEALLLEASLIKKHRPRYNIVLRDDKEYLLFRLRGDQPYPRLEVIRKSSLRGEKRRSPQGQSEAPRRASPPRDKLYGPYSSGAAARETWRILHRAFPLRRCRDRSFANRTRPCLYHHMGQCLGPCVLPVSEADYRALVRQVDLLLTGRSSDLLLSLEKEMHGASEALEFELAARLRDQLRSVRHTVEKQAVVLAQKENIDLVGIAQIPEGLALGVVFVRDGLLLDGRNFFWPGLSFEETPELLASFLTQYYLTGKATCPKRVVVPWLPGRGKNFEPPADRPLPPGSSPPGPLAEHPQPEPLAEGPLDPTAISPAEPDSSEFLAALEAALSEAAAQPVTVSCPRNAEEDRLLLMAAQNAGEAARTNATPPLAETLQRALHAPGPIARIEAVDISHTSGRQTRAGMVVFENEQPRKSDYRLYALDDSLAGAGAQAGDDYAALAAWASRRAAAGPPWADLVLIDGGRGQLGAVQRIFTGAGVAGEFTLASIAKARTEEGRADRRAGNTGDRIFLPGRANPLNIRPGSPELLFLQRVRDTVHDFVIGRHRKARAKAALAGELTRLPGVGPKMAALLYSHFESLEAMARAGEDGLRTVPGIGPERAAMLAKRLALLVRNDE
jgi:Nuclease subunit of the excinuclease complex